MAGRGELPAATLRGTGKRTEGTGGVGMTGRVQGRAHLGGYDDGATLARLTMADLGEMGSRG